MSGIVAKAGVGMRQEMPVIPERLVGQVPAGSIVQPECPSFFGGNGLPATIDGPLLSEPRKGMSCFAVTALLNSSTRYPPLKPMPNVIESPNGKILHGPVVGHGA